LLIGIALLPFLFVWCLLRTGYSRTERVVGFSWAMLALLAALTLYRLDTDADQGAVLDVPTVHQPGQTNEDAVKVTALGLAGAYMADEVAAQRSFGFGPLEVSGSVTDVSLDMMGNPMVQFQGPDEFHQPQASFTQNYRRKIEKLLKGDVVVVRCSSIIGVGGIPRLSGCEL